MLKDLTTKGLLLGMMTGLLVTLFDSFFMFNLYVPYSFPILLIVFNTFFWLMVGGLSGFSIWAFVRIRGDFKRKEHLYWILFYLFPFALIYGFLGRFYLPLRPLNAGPPPVFDHHLSFVWVLLIFIILIFFSRKFIQQREFFPTSFVPEIVTPILLFQFCSNLNKIKTISEFYSNYSSFFEGILKLKQNHYQIIVYILGVLFIICFYFITLRTNRFLRGSASNKRIYSVVGILFIVVIIFLGVFFLRTKRVGPQSDFRTIAAEQANKEVLNVILIVLDTVRADHLSMYGNPNVTKNLEEFSQDALVFENCVAPSPWTMPSHASLFTGLYPSEHGVHTNLQSKQKDFHGFSMPFPLSFEFVTLAEKFRDNGYTTGAVVSNYILTPMLYISQGFQVYNIHKNIGYTYVSFPFRPLLHLFSYLTNISPKYIKPYRSAEDINSESFDLLEKLGASPFFLFINYLDAHGPFLPPQPYNGYFLDSPFPQLHKLKQYFFHFLKRLSKESWDSFLLSQYDGEIAYLDDQLGRLFSFLKQRGLYDSSLIIVTSDHGELFGEHGLYSHRQPMYEGVVKVPLIIKFPFSKKAGREKKLITLADLHPTILSICKLPISDDISGQSFGNTAVPAVSEFYDNGIGKHQILYDGKYKYMQYEYKRGPELYDLENDPMEKENLVAQLPEVTLVMKEKLQAWRKTHGPKYKNRFKMEDTPSQEILEGLKALGYIQ